MGHRVRRARSPATTSSAASRSRTTSRARSAYFEPRYNINPDLQLYVGVAGASISFPNRAAAEIDFYAGIRPTFGKLALDIGCLYYWYPGGQCFHAFYAGARLRLRVNAARSAAADQRQLHQEGSELPGRLRPRHLQRDRRARSSASTSYFTDSFLNSGASGTYASGTIKYTFPAFTNGVAVYTSGGVRLSVARHHRCRSTA